MNLKLSNQLNMVGACLAIAQSTENKPVWDGKPPADFAADLALLQTAYQAALTKAAQADGAQGGAADAKAQTESALENAAHLLARALTSHYRKTDALDSLAKVDVSRTEIVRLRNQDLLAKATEIRDLAATAKSEPGAAGRGITAERIAVLTAALTAFAGAMSAPRGQIVNRSTLLKELETDIAALVESVAALDDLVIQFDTSPAGLRLIEAWRRARMIIDAGGGHSNGNAAPASPPATPAPAK